MAVHLLTSGFLIQYPGRLLCHSADPFTWGGRSSAERRSMTVWTSLESPKTTLMAASFAVGFRLDLCNAPTGVKGQTLAKRVRLLGKSTRSYGKPSDEVSLVLRWTSKLWLLSNTIVQDELL